LDRATLRRGLCRYELRVRVRDFTFDEPVDETFGEVVDFFDEADAQHFLLEMMSDYVGNLTIREFAHKGFCAVTCHDLEHRNDQQLARVLAEAIQDRKLMVIRHDEGVRPAEAGAARLS